MSSASVITCSLLLLMTSLISLGNTPPPAEPPIKLEFTGAKPPAPKPPIQRVKPVQPPPPPPLPRSESGVGVSWTPDNLVYELPTDPGFGHEFVGIDNARLEVKPMQDSPAIIVSAVPPAYPSKLAQRGIEGFVDVQYDVTPAGVAENITILQSTHRGFEPAATAATKKMRFKPRIVDGTPVAELGLSRRFRFEMEND
ncbi:MAG: energy transducer TonB [Pseudomonadota bacterium]